MKLNKDKLNKPTFNEILAEVRIDTRKTLWDKGVLSNRIAKISRGNSRRVAYAEKTKKLQALVAQGEALVKVDEKYEYEILSIELNHRKRLHAHVGEIQNSSLAHINPQHIDRRGA